MSTEVIPVIQPTPVRDRARLVRRAKALSWLSIGWMTVEAAVGVTAAVVAGSVALLGFGLDSLIELASATTILWRFAGSRAHSDRAERRAQQVIAACLVALALYLTYDAITTLAGASKPQTSWPGIAVCLAAIVVMPLLAQAKRGVAVNLGSAATAGDATQSRLCALIAAGALLSILTNATAGWWWLDPIVGVAIAGIALQEARAAWSGEVCADCAPISIDSCQDCEDCHTSGTGPLPARPSTVPRC